MSKKDYIKIANILVNSKDHLICNDQNNYYFDKLINSFCSMFTADNEKFNEYTFKEFIKNIS